MLEQVPRSCSILFRGNISPNRARPTTALSRSIPITIFANIQFNQTWTFLISSLWIFQIIVPIIILNINPLCFFFETSRKIGIVSYCTQEIDHSKKFTIYTITVHYYLSFLWKKLRKSHRITWQINLLVKPQQTKTIWSLNQNIECNRTSGEIQ